MNSWDCHPPSPEALELRKMAHDARIRVQNARHEHAQASPETQDFWAYLLADRLAELEVIETRILKEKEKQPSTPDPLENGRWLKSAD